MKIGFIGAGNMASAIIQGLLRTGHAPETLMAADPGVDAGNAMRALGVACTQDNAELVQWADVVVIAVKPQLARAVLQPLADFWQAKPLISLCAGLPLRFFEGIVGEAPMIRTMPNTPALVGQGATGLYANTRASAELRSTAEQIFNAGGRSAWVDDEALLDAVTAASGSGPAYFFALIEHMIAAGIELGLDPETAKSLVCQTALGAATMTLESTDEPGVLRQRVTSKGGTTAAALAVFESGEFDRLVKDAMQAACDRAQALGREA